MPAPTIFEVAPTPRSTWRGPRRAARTPRTISSGLVSRSRSASESSCRSVGSGRASQRGGGAGVPFGSRVEVEEDGGDVDPGDAVDQRVVALADDREAAVVQALDQPQLPERLAAVELLGEDPRRQVAQLLVGAGRRQRGLAHVVLEVEVRVVDPDRPALVERHGAQLLAEARHQVQARGDVVAELLVGGRRALEDDRAGDVHVRARPLHVQEGRVQPGQPVSSHSVIFAARKRARRNPCGHEARPELQLPAGRLRLGLGFALEAGDADAEQPHRPLRVVGAQQLEGGRDDDRRVVGRLARPCASG